MSSGTTVKQFPTAIDTFATWEDDVDTIAAHIVNDTQDQIIAVETNMGAGVQGSLADLKTRLAVSMNNDGTLKTSTQGVTGVQGLQGVTGIQGAQGNTGVQGVTGGAVLYTGIQKSTITVVAADGTYAYLLPTPYADNSYQVNLTPVGTNATLCWAVLSGAKTTTGFTIALMTAGTNGAVPFNASTGAGGVNVNVDVIAVHA